MADLNTDGRPDIVTANYYRREVSGLMGNGSGRFDSYQQFPIGVSPVFVAVADLNGDGVPDIVTEDAGGNEVLVDIYTRNQ